MSDEEVSKHEFGPGVIPELATRLYKVSIAAFREGVSNALDAMIPFEEKRVEIRTNVRPGGDITIEDWGTGIEDYKLFKVISPGKKIVGREESSRTKVSENIIGEKGMGKLSFLNLSEINTVEFHSNHENVGMRVTMTMENFSAKYMNSNVALPHHGLKVTIKQAKKSDTPETKRLVDYLGRVFAIRIARGAQIYVNGERVPKAENFDSHQYELFKLDNGRSVYGNLKSVSKPRTSNIDFCVKQLFVESKGFDYEVEGWINCDDLELDTSRAGLYEGGGVYLELMNKLLKHLDENYDKKSDERNNSVKSHKQLAKIFVDVIRSIRDLYPEMNNPLMSGKSLVGNSNVPGGPSDKCSEQAGIVDKSNTEDRTIGKPIGTGNGHKHGNGESTVRKLQGNGKILSPEGKNLVIGNTISEPTVVVLKSEGKPVVFYTPPNRLVINQWRSSSDILLSASPRDPNLKSRVLPLLVRAGINAFPGSYELTKEEWDQKYDTVLDSVWMND